jgi:hypothetical protein
MRKVRNWISNGRWKRGKSSTGGRTLSRKLAELTQRAIKINAGKKKK